MTAGTSGAAAACSGPCLSGRAVALGAGAPPPRSAPPEPPGTAAAPPMPCPSARLGQHPGPALAPSTVSVSARPSEGGGAGARVRPNQYAPAAASSAPRACKAASPRQRRRHRRCILAQPLRWPEALQARPTSATSKRAWCTPHTLLCHFRNRSQATRSPRNQFKSCLALRVGNP